MIRFRSTAGIAGLLLALLGAPVAAKDFTWASDGDINSMDPHSRSETFQFNVLNNVYEGLVQRGRDFLLEPALAISWENASPSEWRFVLRDGVRFHDGSPLTADDVVFSLQRAMGPTSDIRARLASVKSITSSDARTVTIETRYPNPILPAEIPDVFIMSKTWAEAHGATASYDYKTKGESFANANENGTGPFKLALREPGFRTVLEPNQGWWGKPEHNITKAEFLVIGASATRTAAFLSGKADAITTVQPQDLARLSQTPGVRLLQRPEARVIYLGFDLLHDQLADSDVRGVNPFRDKRVRQAIFQAIDEDGITAKVMRGAARPTALMIAPEVVGYDKAMDRRLPFDLEAARKLLAEAGYPKGFSFGMDCPNDRYLNDEATCTAIVAMLARIGITAKLESQSKIRYFPKVEKRESPLYLVAYSPGTFDGHNVLLRLLMTPNVERREGDINYGAYSNPRIDELTRLIAVETDQPKRLAMLKEAFGLARDDVATIPLHNPGLTWAVRDTVDSLVQTADDRMPLRYVRLK